MNTKQLQLVTYEQARALKKAGFDWETDDYFAERPGGAFHGNKKINPPLPSNDTMRPTVALALKWMRDVKIFHYSINFDVDSSGTFYIGTIMPDEIENVFPSYEEAESALLDELLTLITSQQ